MRDAYLPDASSGYFAPGWDIGLDDSGDTAHLAALRAWKSFSRRFQAMCGLYLRSGQQLHLIPDGVLVELVSEFPEFFRLLLH